MWVEIGQQIPQELPQFLILPEVTDPSNYRGGKVIYSSAEPYVFVFMGNVTSSVWANRTLRFPTGVVNVAWPSIVNR